MTAGDPDVTTRQRRHLTEVAIGQATRGEWEAAVATNREILELGGDTDAYNRLGKALAELGRNAEALEAYQSALERDATNRIAERNVGGCGSSAAATRPRWARASPRRPPPRLSSRRWARPVMRPPHQPAPRQAARPALRRGRVELVLDGALLLAKVGEVEDRPGRAAHRLTPGQADEGRQPVRGCHHHGRSRRGAGHHPRGLRQPRNFGKVSFPGPPAAARVTSGRT